MSFHNLYDPSNDAQREVCKIGKWYVTWHLVWGDTDQDWMLDDEEWGVVNGDGDMSMIWEKYI